MGHARPLRRGRGLDRGKRRADAPLCRQRRGRGARRGGRSGAAGAGLARRPADARQPAHLHLRPQDRGHRPGLEGRDRDGQRGRCRRGAGPASGPARRFRQDHRQHPQARALPLRRARGEEAGHEDLGPHPGQHHRSGGRRGRPVVDRTPRLRHEGGLEGRGRHRRRLSGGQIYLRPDHAALCRHL
ncbi:hypothetical protein D3C81_1394250 [compost metagenome]